MKYCSALYAVRSIEAAQAFYQQVLGQNIVLDHGTNVTFEGGFALQEAGLLALFVLAVMGMVNSGYHPFIYFQY